MSTQTTTPTPQFKHIEIACEEIHAKFFSQGMTRYTYAQVIESAAAFDAAQTAFDAAVEDAATLLQPAFKQAVADYGPYAALGHLPDHLHELQDLSGDTPPIDLNPSSSEHFPVGKWNRFAATLRALTKKIRAATEKARITAPATTDEESGTATAMHTITHTVRYKGIAYKISDEAYDALGACYPEIADGAVTSDEATEAILRAEGYNLNEEPETPLRSALADLVEHQRFVYRTTRAHVHRDLQELIGDLQQVAAGLEDAPDGDLEADFGVLNRAVAFSSQLDRRGVGGALASLMAQAQMIVKIEHATSGKAE